MGPEGEGVVYISIPAYRLVCGLSIPIEDILAGVEKPVQSLPVETGEDARQETLRI
jgi:hypothetical protein